MKTSTIRCPICGFAFDPSGKASCAACPINKGCTMVCCPNCGYTTINTDQSSLARLASKFLKRKTNESSI